MSAKDVIGFFRAADLREGAAGELDTGRKAPGTVFDRGNQTGAPKEIGQ
jgi:hypothetical protein